MIPPERVDYLVETFKELDAKRQKQLIEELVRLYSEQNRG